MSKKLLYSIIVVLLITNVATMLFWIKDNQETNVIDGEKVNRKESVATINETTEISYEEWMEALQYNYGKKQLTDMINKSVVEMLAKEKNITVNEKVIKRDIALLTTTEGLISEEKLTGLEEKWREDIIYRYQLEALLTEGIQIPEEEIQSYYADYQNQYQFDASYQLSHILLSTMDEAEKVYEELEAGASFPLLAKEYSIDESTRENGGYLGFNSVNTQFLPNNYFDIVTTLQDYSYSEPFVTDNGIAIVYLHKSLPEISFSYEELAPYIRNELALRSINQGLEASPLWDRVDIKWIYEK